MERQSAVLLDAFGDMPMKPLVHSKVKNSYCMLQLTTTMLLVCI